jgi:2-polyprenyl-3-methyl-5-hydroxy-6-metoxy-1,4-benzoquinol methylase
MSSREYYEALWRSLPEGMEPADRALREKFLCDHVGAGERVLDVGCGDGTFADALRGHGAHVVGIDLAEEPLRRAHARDPELELKLVDGEGPWPLEDASFDAVWAGEVIEHVLDTATWLSEVRRVLRSGGSLLLSTPDNGPLSMMRAALSRRAYVRRFDPQGDHLRFYDRRTLSRLLEDFGFGAVEIHSYGGLPGARRGLLAHAVRSRF